MTRRTLTLAAAIAVAAGLAAAWAVSQRNARERIQAEEARALLEDARSVLAASARENIVALAAEAFALATAETERGEAILAAGRAVEAIPVGRAAAALAREAREKALGNVTVARAALLVGQRNKVYYRPAEGVAWSEAQLNMSLFNRDRISTKERSQAMVRFAEGNEMRVEENSTMVVERLVEDRAKATFSVTLGVPEGGLRSAIARTGDRDIRLEINLPAAGVVVDTTDLAGGRAEVGTRVHPDQTNRVAVYTGAAEVVAPSGDRVVVQQNQFAEVSPDGRLSAPRELPTSAIVLLPGEDATVYVSSQRPEVTFKWKSQGECRSYRLEVARGTELLDAFLDEPVSRSSFTYGNFAPGRYFWRVSCRDEKGTEGRSSAVSRFDLVLDNEAPRLSVVSPEVNAVVAKDQVEARCRTEAGVAVFINGEEAAASRPGEYARLVHLSPGVNTLVFEAVDGAGNVIYNSRLVTRKGP